MSQNQKSQLLGKSCLLELKPTKIPKKSKKIYKDVFVRKKGNFHHLYQLDGLYIASVHIDRDAHDWIDRNEEKIRTYTWLK